MIAESNNITSLEEIINSIKGLSYDEKQFILTDLQDSQLSKEHVEKLKSFIMHDEVSLFRKEYFDPDAEYTYIANLTVESILKHIAKDSQYLNDANRMLTHVYVCPTESYEDGTLVAYPVYAVATNGNSVILKTTRQRGIGLSVKDLQSSLSEINVCSELFCNEKLTSFYYSEKTNSLYFFTHDSYKFIKHS